jgi:LEA14-like dessication related protein
VAAAAAASTLAGCAGLEGVLRQGIQKPEVSVVSAAPTAIDFEGIGVEVELRVQNPNAIGLRVAGFSWQLDVDGARVATGDAPGGLSLPASGAANSRLTARFRFADLANLAKSIEGTDQVSVHVAGKVGVETPIGVMDVPWSVTKALPTPRLPRVELGGIRLGKQSFTEAEVVLRLRVQNPNPFPLPAASVKLDVDLAGDRVAQAASQQLAPIPAEGAGTIELPVRMSLLGAGRALLGARGRSIPVAVRGTAGFAWMQYPFSVTGELPLP